VDAIQLPTDQGVAALLARPFAVGEAPFRIKGNAYRGHVSYVDREIAGGFEAHQKAVRELDPVQGPALVEFFSQSFLPSGWYDVYPLALAGVACARITDEAFLDFVFRRTCAQGEDDIGGIYRFLLKFVSAKAIALRVPGLVARYFDFVEPAVEVEDPWTLRASFTGVPVALTPWWLTVVQAYIQTVVELAGKPRPTTHAGRVFDGGTREGVRVCGSEGVVELAKPPSASE
jgi:hypothetical protein